MISTQVVANTILMLSFNENIPVSPMKLQKLMYFTYKDYLKTYDAPLFADRFECWQYGPVLSSIYYEFNRFGAKPINKFARDANGSVTVVNMDSYSQIAQSIQNTWDKYKRYSGIQLSHLTHKENSAWSYAHNKKSHTLEDKDIKNEPEYD